MKIKPIQFIILSIFIITSLLCTVLILFDSTRPEYYKYLFLLPMVFMLISICIMELYRNFLQNLAISIIIFLYFCRMVISPLFMYLGNYTSTISHGIAENTENAILLVCYEIITVFMFFWFISKNKKINERCDKVNDSEMKGKRAYILLVTIMLFVLFICYLITPQLSMIYRTIFNMNDEFFSNHEDSYIINKYATSFITKFSLVLGNYIARISILVIPASILILLWMKKKKGIFTKIVSNIICFVPLFFISGAIARSLIYIVSLLLLKTYLYKEKTSGKGIFFIGLMAAIAIVIWWINKASLTTYSNMFEYFSNRFSSYFSGVNIISGVFNLPKEFEYKFRYFIYDFISTIPFGNTIFNIKHITVQTFFNEYNNSYGQIPPTIGMGYYYLGPILAPTYSIIFSYIAYISAEKLRKKSISNPFQYIRLIYTVFVFCMGIIMYNIEITMINVFCMIIPMYLLEIVAYGGKKNVN